jgi:serine/threonine-protein kinase
MSAPSSFFTELRRRHVYRVAVAYVVVGWLLIQFATQVFPVLSLPTWTQTLVVLLVAIGFPIALILAWAFEMTPDGIRRTEPAHSPEARPAEFTQHVGKKLNAIIIGVMALVIVLLLAERFLPHTTQSESAPAVASGANTPAPSAPAKSIAVLPFENLSEDKGNGYFASGMQDEILTRLAGIHDLQVISRTSTEKYASHPPDLKTVGKELGVATLLEGSVQKAGDAVHINVQLIDASNDHHLWAQSYDRDLKDIFAVERDVAQSIADALKAQLKPQEGARVAAVPTTNPAAYDLYLRGMEHFNRASDQDVLTASEMPQAIALFDQALAADPQFALAAGMLGQAHMSIYFNAAERSGPRLAAAKSAIDRALALQPDLGEAHVALALYHYWGHRDYAAATEQLELARQALPNNTNVAGLSGAIARRQGRWDDAIAGFQRASLFDPRGSYPLDQLGLTYAALRRYMDADRAFGRSVQIAPDPADERVTHAINTLRWKGDLVPMREALQALVPGSDAYSGNAASFFWLDWYSRDFGAAARVADADQASEWGDQGNIALPRELHVAWAYEAAGDSAKAREHYAGVKKSASEALSMQPETADRHLALAFADAGLAGKDDALREGRRAVELMPPGRDALSGSGMLVWLAVIEARVGERDAAFDHLRQALALPSGGSVSAAMLKLDPHWDPLRSDPRFEQLIALGDVPVSIAQKP